MRHRAWLLTLLFAGPAVAQPGAPQPSWDRAFFNPAEQARAGDVVLPLPCGGAMAFRPVVTPRETLDALADFAMQLGRANAETGYLDYLRQQHLLGTLSGADGNWFFLIGKYGVTRDQWQAVTEPGRCSAPSEVGRLPQGDISWFEAVDYARRLTEWLLRERRGALPAQGAETTFLRLPTEAEWEFAARGGIVSGAAAFAAERFFPDTEPAAAFVVFREPGRERRPRPVGSRRPNPLELYDMLGNMEQWVLEPFRANRLGREHGQPGGFVTRGGSYDTEEPGIRTALRSEYAPYNAATGLPWRHPKIGFRLVVAAPVLASERRTREMQEAWIRLNEAAAAATDLLAELDRLAAAGDPPLRAPMAALKRLAMVERGQRDEVQGRLLGTALMNGALLVRGLRQDTRLAEVLRVQAAGTRAAAAAQDPARAARERETLRIAEANLAEAEERRRFGERAFTDAIAQLARDVPAEQQAGQREKLVQTLDGGGLGALRPFLDRFDRALSAYRGNRGMDPAALVRLATQDPPGGDAR